MDPLSGYWIFAQVVAAGGFSQAAKTLGVSKSTVSKQISRLEARLGARLLNRTTRTVVMTEAGEAFYERARAIVAEAQEAQEAVNLLQAKPTGVLRVNAPMSFGTLHVAPRLPKFLKRYPDLTIDLCLDDQIIDVLAGHYDVVIRIARLPDSSLIARRICSAPHVVCASPTYLDRAGTPGCPDDLRQHNCLIYSHGETGNEWRFSSQSGREIRVPVSGSLTANNGEVLRDAAVAGIGIAVLPAFIATPPIEVGTLTRILSEFDDVPERQLGVHALYPPGRFQAPKVRAFIDFMISEI